MAPNWKINNCAGFVVKPSKNMASQPTVTGSLINMSGDLQNYFQEIFESSTRFPINSIFSTNGPQQNSVRDLIIDMCNGKTKLEKTCVDLANRLAKFTDRRSNEVLFVILIGSASPETRVVILTLPSNEALIATEERGTFQLSLTKDAFSKDSSYFKAAMFEGNPNSKSDFWQSKIEDLQAKQYAKGVSEYWLRFLDSKLEITDQRMTRSIMAAAKKAFEKTESVADKEAILAGIKTATAQTGSQITAEKFIQNYVPPNQKEAVKKYSGLASDELQQPFKILPDVVQKEIAVKTIWVDGQFSISGPSDTFDQKVAKKSLNDQEMEFTLKGRITNEKLTRTRASRAI